MKQCVDKPLDTLLFERRIAPEGRVGWGSQPCFQTLLKLPRVRKASREPQFLSYTGRLDTVPQAFRIPDATMFESRMGSLVDDCTRNLDDIDGRVEHETRIQLARARAVVVVGPAARKQPNPNAGKVAEKSTITLRIVRPYEAEGVFHASQRIRGLRVLEACADPQAVHFAPVRDRQREAI